jgi:glycosyltransferase involved in cell wall biosynthesis
VRIIARLNVGGPALHASLLTERMDPGRYDSLLVAGTEDPGEGNYLALRGKPLDRLVVLPTLGRDIRSGHDLVALAQLVRLIRRVRPHVVHTHTAKAGTLGRLAALLARVPIVVHTYHGHVFQGYFSPRKTRLFLAVERWLARRTDQLLTVSETVREELLRFGIGTPERLTVLRLGLDLDRYLTCEARRSELRRELGVEGPAPLVGIVARLVPIKAHEVFLRAARSVSDRVPDARFLVVGDGERRHELEAMARDLGVGPRVWFLGWRADLDRIYADLDLAVLCSRNEGSPVSLIEAMASARPVVATRVGGVPDVVDDGVTGHLVAPNDASALADAGIDLLSDPERRRAFGDAGRKRAYPAYGAERLLADVARIYGELLEKKGVSPWTADET